MEGNVQAPSGNPRSWKFTWEAQSQLPILKLFIFSDGFTPSVDCKGLQVELKFERSLLLVAWGEEEAQVSLAVPVPRVLVDLESPVSFRALDDHVEVKVGLLLAVDHPIVSTFISELNAEDGNVVKDSSSSEFSKPLVLESDAEILAASGESHFYCRECSFKLTERPIRSFVEMPSMDWREAADNWFGTCCCSFGGISEQLVANYAKSYTCRQGSCLLATTSIIVHEDDLVGFNTQNHDTIRRQGDCGGLSDATSNGSFSNESNDGSCSVGRDDDLVCEGKDNLTSVPVRRANINEKDDEAGGNQNRESTSKQLDTDTDVASAHGCCGHNSHEPGSKDREVIKTGGFSMYEKLLLNGYLGNMFMFKSSGLSREIKWVEFVCPGCSSLLGAYPSVGGVNPIDSGIRLLKCYISSSSLAGSSGNLFRKYTLERMFSAQLMEDANDELSFRTAITDLQSRSARLHMVLLNPDSWHYSGTCQDGTVDYSPIINLNPVIKVLFTATSETDDSGSTNVQSKRKDQTDEVFMLDQPIKEVHRSLKSGSSTFPPSFRFLEGLSLSVLQR